MSVEPTTDVGSVSLEGFKRHARIATSDRDDDMRQYLAAACEMVESITGVDVTDTARDLAVYAAGSTLVLPVVRVAAVSRITDPDGNVLDLDDDCTIDLRAGLVKVNAPRPGTWLVALTHTVPASMALAVHIIATHLLQTERGTAGNNSRTNQQPEAVTHGWGYALPKRARDLLDPFAGPGFA